MPRELGSNCMNGAFVKVKVPRKLRSGKERAAFREREGGAVAVEAELNERLVLKGLRPEIGKLEHAQMKRGTTTLALEPRFLSRVVTGGVLFGMNAALKTNVSALHATAASSVETVRGKSRSTNWPRLGSR